MTQSKPRLTRKQRKKIQQQQEQAEIEAKNLKDQQEQAEIEAKNLKDQQEQAEIEAKNLKDQQEQAVIETKSETLTEYNKHENINEGADTPSKHEAKNADPSSKTIEYQTELNSETPVESSEIELPQKMEYADPVEQGRNDCIEELLKVKQKVLELDSQLEATLNKAQTIYEEEKKNFEFYSDDHKTAIEEYIQQQTQRYVEDKQRVSKIFEKAQDECRQRLEELSKVKKEFSHENDLNSLLESQNTQEPIASTSNGKTVDDLNSFVDKNTTSLKKDSDLSNSSYEDQLDSKFELNTDKISENLTKSSKELHSHPLFDLKESDDNSDDDIEYQPVKTDFDDNIVEETYDGSTDLTQWSSSEKSATTTSMESNVSALEATEEETVFKFLDRIVTQCKDFIDEFQPQTEHEGIPDSDSITPIESDNENGHSTIIYVVIGGVGVVVIYFYAKKLITKLLNWYNSDNKPEKGKKSSESESSSEKNTDENKGKIPPPKQ